ncbi:MAG: CHAD domain-containing protein [Thermoguttaceae bacterium]|jgi:CHAD domain-containing protein
MTRSTDLSYRLLAARFIRRQAKQLAEQLDGIRQGDDDIEWIHRARVASRRLRAALQMFGDCWGRKKIKRWRKQIRKITCGLGEARDKDVQIEFLSGMLGATAEKGHAPGIARLLARVEREREWWQPRVCEAVERLAASRVLRQMQQAGKRVLARAAAGPIELGELARSETKRFILEQLRQMLQEEDSLESPEDDRRHHAMRIAAKRLRYTLEIANPLYAGRLDDCIEATRKVQSLLGDVHDCDVWLQHLDAFQRAECLRILAYFGSTLRWSRLQPGINYLRHDRCERRRQAFSELVRYWEELKRQGTWQRLVRVVEEPQGAVGAGELPPAAVRIASAPAAPAAPSQAEGAGPAQPPGRSKTNGSPPPREPLTAGR